MKDIKSRQFGLRFIRRAVAVIFVWSAIRRHDYLRSFELDALPTFSFTGLGTLKS